MEQVSTDKLMQDLRVVVTDAEELLKATAGVTGEKVEKIRAKAEESLIAARKRLQTASKAVQQGAVDVAETVDEEVHKNPWRAVGVAAGVGLVIGILISRR